ncbi:MAG: helix-turn-helix domain-containing protein [Steroidobacteraceae bacterium]
MTQLTDWVNANPERQREFAEERLIVDAAEEIWDVMERENISKSDLARFLGKSKAYVSQALSGSRNMTLRTLASIAHFLGYEAEVFLRRRHAEIAWLPLKDAIVVQLRPSILSPHEVDVSNDGKWQTVDGVVDRAEAA